MLSLFFTNSVFSQQQPYDYKIEVLYSMTSIPDSNDVDKQKSEIMSLLVGNEQSLFTSRRYIAMDSAMTSELKKGNSFGPSMSFYEERGTKTTMTIFKTSSNIIYYGKPAPFINKVYQYYESKPILDWKIKDETTLISGIECQKATARFGGRKWIAWFAPSIGVNEGPYKFSGLPGLIVNIYDEKKHWIMELMRIRNIDKSLDLNFSNIKPELIGSKTRFLEEKKYSMENRLQIMQSKGWTYEKPMATRKRFDKEAKEDNNWIEFLISE
nr:GLPGLI family protein [Salegentibacter lacus]